MLNITSNQLDSLKSSIDINSIIKNKAYYVGKNPEILKEPNRRKPDNKIPVAIGYRLISNLSGFAARTGDIFINHVPLDPEAEDTNESEYEEARKKIDRENEGLLLNSQLYVEVLKQGIAYDVVWTVIEDDELKIKYAQIPNYQAVPVWTKELQTVKSLEYFVRFWDDDLMVGSAEAQKLNITITGQEKITINYAQVFETGGYQKYYKFENKEWERLDEFVPQPFNTVQVSAYRANINGMPYIEPVMVLIDQMDKMISRNMNEVERFNNSLLGVLKAIDPEVKTKIDQMGVIDNLISGLEANSAANVFPKFITREIPTNHAQMMIETIGRLIYEIMGSPNFTAESFGTASGIALLYRLIGLEYSASEIDVWYDQGLKKRDELIKQALQQRENSQEFGNDFQPVIVHNRNLPVDIGFLAENALKLKALGISLETILNLFPKSIIADVKKEIEKMEENSNNLLPPIDDDDEDENDDE